MKSGKWLIVPILVLGMLSMTALAQDAPRDDEQGGPGGPGGPPGAPERRDAGPGQGRAGIMRGARGSMQMGQGPGMQMRQGAMQQMRQGPVEILRGYLELVEQYSRLTRDPVTTGVAAVIQAADILRPRGTDAAIDYFNKLLPSVKNETIQRAIHIQLAELYKNAGQQDKALSELQGLITGAPAGATITSDNAPPPGR
jgi:hypothetical protein